MAERKKSRGAAREEILKDEKYIKDRRYAEDLGRVFEGVQGEKARAGNYANTKLLNDAEAEYERKHGNLPKNLKKGGKVKKFAKGGGCELRGKTRGRMV